MAKDCDYPVALDAAPTDKSTGNEIPSTDWNKYSDGYLFLENTVGITGSAVTTSMDYKIKNSSSVNPGHRHTALFDYAGTSYALSGGSTLDRITIAGVDYYVPSAAATTGALLYNDGTGKLSWNCKIKARMCLTAAQTITNGTEEELVLDSISFETVAGVCDISTGRITPGIAGYYLIGGAAQITNLADGKNTYTSLYLNGVPYVYGERHNTGAAGTNGGTAMLISPLDNNDNVSIGLFNGDTSNRASATGSDAVYLWLYGPL